MHAPAMSGREARELLDKVLGQDKTNNVGFDRDIFEAVYGPFGYKKPFRKFCRRKHKILLPPEVVVHCQGKLQPAQP